MAGDQRRTQSRAHDSVRFQSDRYDAEAQAYRLHHGDSVNQRYRDRFIRKQLFDFDLDGMRVLDAMSASGIEAGFLISQGAHVTGLDISKHNAALYREAWNRPCFVRSIHDTGFEDEEFDVVYIFGGLHHIIPLLDETIAEVYRILSPGGYFCFVEPNADTWLNVARRIWYRWASRFHNTEQALSYDKHIRPHLALGFKEECFISGGNVAYLLIGQSMVLGMPTWAKRLLHNPLFFFELLIDHIPGAPRLYFAAAWRKAKQSHT